MKIAGQIVGVCSWSLRPRDMADLAAQVKQLGLEHVQLAMGPLLDLDEKCRGEQLDLLRNAGISITAGMIGFNGEDYSTIARIRETGGYVPDQEWPLRRDITLNAARLAAEIGVKLLSVHVGFVPSSNQPTYNILKGRVQELAKAMAALGVDLLMETGQENAAELLQFLNDLAARNVHVNFDPANMILYGAGNPIDAIKTLGRHIRHVHVKDGTMSDQPGIKWGEEVPFGSGQVPPRQFLAALKSVGYTGPLCIEREAGESRLADVRTAIQTLRSAAGEA